MGFGGAGYGRQGAGRLAQRGEGGTDGNGTAGKGWWGLGGSGVEGRQRMVGECKEGTAVFARRAGQGWASDGVAEDGTKARQVRPGLEGGVREVELGTAGKDRKDVQDGGGWSGTAGKACIGVVGKASSGWAGLGKLRQARRVRVRPDRSVGTVKREEIEGNG